MTVTKMQPRVPRIVEAPSTPAPATSATLRADLDRLDQDRAAAVADLARLEGSRRDVLLSGDDAAAERHDAEMARQRRAIERADLRRPGIVDALDGAEQREEAERITKIKNDANGIVSAFLKTAEERYRKPALELVAFLQEWQRVSAIAKEAGVPGPNAILRTCDRVLLKPERVEEESYFVFVDENGVEMGNEWPAGSYREINGQRHLIGTSGRPSAIPAQPHRKVEKTRTVRRPAEWQEATYTQDLAYAVKLPNLQLGEPFIWPKADQA
jgi:hypothetical protein